MEARIVVQGKNDPPQLQDLMETGKVFADFTNNPSITFCVVEGGMKSGEPAVIIASKNDGVNVILQTSLDKFLMAAVGMTEAAKERWGWEQPEGYVSIFPMMDPETSKRLLESLKKEIEEIDNGL